MKFELGSFSVKVYIENIEESKIIKKYLTRYFKYNYLDPKTKKRQSINNYEIIDKIVYLPKNLFKKLYETKKILNVDKTIPEFINKLEDTEEILFNCSVKLNNNQKLILDYIDKNNMNNFILKSGAGTGKTFIAMSLINYFKRKTLIIVPITCLLEQWAEKINEYFKDIKLSFFYGKKKDLSGDIVIAIINTVCKQEINIKFGLVLLDEVHMYNTKSFKTVYNKITCKNMVGISATPLLRENGFDKIGVDNIGEILDVETIKDYEKADNKFDSTAHLIYYNGPEEYTKTIINEKNGMVDVISMITNIISDPNRNKLIIEQIIKLSNLNHNIFVFSDRRIHLELLYAELSGKSFNDIVKPLKFDFPEIEKSIILFGGSSKEDIKEATEFSNVIFTTYKYSSTGLSIDKLDALILATPRRSNMTQIINRIFRLNEEYKNKKRYIIDIVDNRTVLKNQVKQRKEAYKERGCNIISSET